jgi:hypothetical protein
MADRILKPDSGNDLVLQNDDGSGKIEVNEDSTISLTGPVSTIDINGGTIDGVTIGTNSAITDLRVDNIKIDGNNIVSTDTDGNIDLTPNGSGEVNISKVDINSGTMDDVDVNMTTAVLTTTTAQKTAIVDGGKGNLAASDVGLGNVTNESKATMFTSPTFTGTPNLGSNPTVTLGTNTTFPSGHVVQTVSQSYNTITVQSIYATVPTHLETEINITAGNKVFYNYTIPTRLLASGYNYGQYKYFVYHKVTSGGTYAQIISGQTQASYYYDLAGNLPNDFYRDVNVCLSGVHTPSSGTQQFYRIYVQFIHGNNVTVGQATSNTQQVTLMEIQS